MNPDLKLVTLHKPKGPSTGLEPYFALERRKQSKPRASTNPDRAWQVLVALIVGIALLAAGFFR